MRHSVIAAKSHLSRNSIKFVLMGDGALSKHAVVPLRSALNQWNPGVRTKPCLHACALTSSVACKAALGGTKESLPMRRITGGQVLANLASRVSAAC